MKNKKRVVLMIIVSCILMISVVSVSAGILDKLFGKDNENLEGEMANTEPATATLTISAASAPVIAYVSDVDDGGRSTFANTVKPDFRIVSPTTPVTFYFIAQSEGGIGVLYTDGSGDTGTNVLLQSPAGAGENLGNIDCSFNSTGAFAEIGGQSGVRYDCSVNMDFWSAPGTIATLNPWSAVVTVTDQNTQTGDNSASPKQFDVETTTQGSTDTSSIDWGNISITATNVYANDVVVQNDGNDLLDIRVTGAEVRASDYATSGKFIPANRFRVDGTGVGCSGGTLNDGVSAVDSGLDVSRGASSTGGLSSCITVINDLGLTAQLYTSRIDWVVDMS